MVEISTTKVSSKGQIVIPSNMRAGFKEGEELLIIRDEDRIILKKTSKVSEQMKEDLEFARRTEEAYKRHEKGDLKIMPVDKFLAELEKW